MLFVSRRGGQAEFPNRAVMKILPRLLLASLAAGAAAACGLVAFTYGETRRVQRLVPVDGEFLEVEGARLHYVDRGQGPPILMVHGLGGQLRNFNYLVDLLAEEFRVILVDRPGSGYSTAPSETGAGLKSQAAVFARFIDKLGLDKPLVVGHSLGGAISLELALDFPERVGALALIAPLSQFEEVLPPAFRGLAITSPRLRTALAWMAVAPASRYGPKTQLEQVFAPDDVPEDFDVRAGGLLARRPSNFLASSADLRGAAEDLADLVARYAQLSVPARVLFGRGDTILNPDIHGRGLEGVVPGLRLDIVDGGHMIPVTYPEETARWIAEAARDLASDPGQVL